jgi:integrase/recombinase XerD
MKKLEINNAQYTRLLESFKRHLQTLNYSKATVLHSTSNVKEYLFYLIENGVELKQSTSQTMAAYFTYLHRRKNERKDGGLSVAYLHKHRGSLQQFYTYLQRVDYYTASLRFPMLQRAKSLPSVLTITEIKQLFKTCDNSLLGKRNKAVLAIYYGLGLRRSEGVNVMLDDVDFHKEEVLISKSKTNRQRRVPMSEFVKNVLEDYVFNAREKLIPSDKQTAALLVTQLGKPLSKESVSYIIKMLVTESKIKTRASAHTLRHSIATHLLQSGMSLENIALFLGHTSLDSTQIYTHLAEPRNNK